MIIYQYKNICLKRRHAERLQKKYTVSMVIIELVKLPQILIFEKSCVNFVKIALEKCVKMNHTTLFGQHKLVFKNLMQLFIKNWY